MLTVGTPVVVLPPFGDGTTVFTIAEVQLLDALGELTPGPAFVGVQYVLDNGVAFLSEHLSTGVE